MPSREAHESSSEIEVELYVSPRTDNDRPCGGSKLLTQPRAALAALELLSAATGTGPRPQDLADGEV